MLQKDKQWYENALLLGIAGSVIAVIGQFAGTIIPIMYGPQSIEDFNIDLDPKSILIDGQDFTHQIQSATVNITITDLHKWLRPYRFKIQFHALGSINEANVIFDPPEIQLPARFESRKTIRSTWNHTYRSGQWGPSRYMYNPSGITTAYIDINTSSTPIGNYPIVIQCIGSDGKMHNSTVTLRIISHGDYLASSLMGGIPVKGEKILAE